MAVAKLLETSVLSARAWERGLTGDDYPIWIGPVRARVGVGTSAL